MTIKLRLVYRLSAPAGISPYRMVDDQDREIRWVNDFLDAQHVHNFSPRSGPTGMTYSTSRGGGTR